MTNVKPNPKLDIPQCMIDGEKFIKWDEDSMVGTPVTLKIDKHGFYLHWMDQNSDADVLDLALLRDTRTGKCAKIPKDPKLRQLANIGNSCDTLEEKTITLVFGADFVNLTFINFCCAKKEVAKLWTDELMKLICNRVQANASALTFLLKAYTKLTLLPDRSGKIPVKNVIKMFTQNKEEKKRIEKALDSSGLASGKNDSLSISAFTFEDFLTFYKNLTIRSEVEKVFDDLCECGNSKRKFMSIMQFVNFINKIQRDPRLNEILHPYANATRAKDLIEEHEPNKYNAQRGLLSFDGFLRYLMSEDNPIMTSSKLELSDDMDQPLAHYFINSSHNTYLTGHQLTGKSSVEMYRQCLLAGCRCVELDFWNGKTEEPVIVHGYTFVPEIPARDVIEAIAESAFKTSNYPVILSFENHCNPRQQAKIAQYCREYFGDMLLETPLDSHKLEPGNFLPPPSLLKRKIIIKNKKKHHHHHHHHHHRNMQKKPMHPTLPVETAEIPVTSVVSNGSPKNAIGNGEIKVNPSPIRQGSKDSSQENEEDDDDDDESSTGIEDEDDESTGAEEIKLQLHTKPTVDKVSSRKETEAGAEISALVNYVQPVHFVSFENAEKKGRCYEMSSFDEKQAQTLLKERPIEFVNYNKNQLSRVYPGGFRFDSANFMPQVFWNAGCQLVAVNYQTLDPPMQLNLGIFEYNGRCGYLLKPEFLRRHDRCFDPFAESTVDGIIAGTVTINVLSGQFLSDKRVGTYVEVDMYGLPTDTVRKKFRTKIVQNNGINPVYEDEPFVFKKVVLPDLASIRITAYEESGRFIGHRVLPVIGLCPGYRHIGLRNESGQPLPLATLFLFVVVKDYVPDDLSDFAEALANPIKFQSELERRTKQLAVLMDDTEKLDGTPAEYNACMATEEQITRQGKRSCPDLTVGNQLPIPFSVSTTPRMSIVPSLLPNLSSASDDTEGSGKLQSSNASETSNKTSPKLISPLPSINHIINAETLEKLMENKAVKEKKGELEKKLDQLKKKLEKDRNRIYILKASSETEKPKSKFHVGNRLVKRLSIKSIDNFTSSAHTSPCSTPTPTNSQDMPPEYSESDSDNVPINVSSRLNRSQLERLQLINKEYATQEKELKEKYHDIIFNTLEKAMRTSQSNQLKTLRVLLEKETDAVMRRLEHFRRTEVKSLSKKHKDKDEMVRVKREVASLMVEKGVNERMLLTEIYMKRKEELEKQHQDIKQQFDEEKSKAKLKLISDYEEKMKSIAEEFRIILDNDDAGKEAV